MTSDWQQWSNWIIEGHFISYLDEGVRYYEQVLVRDLAHWEYEWPERIAPGATSGPFIPDDLEITKGYDVNSRQNNIWQVIFGIQTQVYLYIEFPTDIHRHGIPKEPKPRTGLREVSHFEEYMSPFIEPSFITEHFMKRPSLFRMAFDAYNPDETIYLQPKLNFFISKMVTERLGTEQNGTLIPTKDIYKETLEKLYKRLTPQRPITLYPVMLPAEAPGNN